MDMTAEIESTDDLIRSARELQEKFWDDPQRPRYHFMAPWGWMNDINGAIFWKGWYHVFYQHLSWGGVYRAMHWGHASSVDLVHWVHHAIALTPSEDGYDRNGCWSGGAFVTREGVPAVIYHGEPGGACIATAEDDMLVRWTKHRANPIVPMTEVFGNGEDRNSALDPCAWAEGDTYNALIGNFVPGVESDGTNLFRSRDLVHWEKIGPFYRSDRRWTEAEEDCAVPDFFRWATGICCSSGAICGEASTISGGWRATSSARRYTAGCAGRADSWADRGLCWTTKGAGYTSSGCPRIVAETYRWLRAGPG